MSLSTLHTKVVLADMLSSFVWQLLNGDRPRPSWRGASGDLALPERNAGNDPSSGIGTIVTLECAAPRRDWRGGRMLSVSGRRIAPTLLRATHAAGYIPWLGKRFRPGGTSRETAASVRDALELVPVAIIGFSMQAEIVFANAKARALFGYRADELIGMSERDLVPGSLADAAPDAHEQVVSHVLAPPGQTTQTVVAKRRDDTEFPAEVTTSASRIDGMPTRLAVIVDCSERVELYRNRRELAHLTRISALGELAGSLAHELNQPLTAILSNAQAAQRFMDAEPINLTEIRETLKDIVADNCRAGEIIRKMRALVRKGDVDLQPLDVGGVVRDVVLLVHSDAVLRGVRTTLDIDAPLPTVRGDKVQLQQVVLNLLLNAFDAVHDGYASDRTVAVRVWAELDGTVRIGVRDRGHGVTVEQLDRIFKPFYTSKPHGLGLGLSISRTIVTAHGGRLWAENNADRGASFYVALPSESTAAADRACGET
ncbi:ATP-binding protein [Burkholderia aenigmatica]|uniref:sensor histidine kinase n=1 Tax=Burkholderia aenigmatica TaxID=2015348 RepID=UPI001F242498|nr:ATP-binding protein [Burkholderia aenigmatica]UKD17197.1 ATP-binding protein [Burkholderia aenigmatica]